MDILAADPLIIGKHLKLNIQNGPLTWNCWSWIWMINGWSLHNFFYWFLSIKLIEESMLYRILHEKFKKDIFWENLEGERDGSCKFGEAMWFGIDFWIKVFYWCFASFFDPLWTSDRKHGLKRYWKQRILASTIRVYSEKRNGDAKNPQANS